MMGYAGQLVGAALAVSTKAYGALLLLGLGFSEVTNPIIAIGALCLAILAIIALWGKAYSGLSTWTYNNRRQAKMLAQFEGSDEHLGVMDEIKSLHVGQADILLAINDLKRSSVRTREGDL